MAAGNRSVLAVLDSRRRADRARADYSVFAALDHFGVAHEVMNAADYMGLPPGHASSRAAYVLAHDGAGTGIKPAIANVRLGLDSLAHGLIMAHEERIDAISLEDWETVIHWTIQGLKGWDMEFALRERVSIICKRLFGSALVYADASPGALHCKPCGRTDGPPPLTVWTNDGDSCTSRTVEVEAFDAFTVVDLN